MTDFSLESRPNPEDDWVQAQNLPAVVVATAERDGPQAAAALVDKHWDRYASTEPAHLLAAVRALPGEVFVDNASMVFAANYLQYVVSGAEPHQFEPNQLSIRPEDAGGPLAAQLIGLTETAAAGQGRGAYAQGVEAALEARQRLDATPDHEVAPQRRILPHLFVQWGLTLELSGDDNLAIEFEYEEAHRLGLTTEQPKIARRAAGHLAWYYALRGRLIAGEYWLERAREASTTDPRYDAVNHLTAALIHIDRRNPEQSRKELALMGAHRIGRYWAAALWVRSWNIESDAERTLLETDTVKEIDRHPAAAQKSGLIERLLRSTWMRLDHPTVSPPATTFLDHALDAERDYRRGDFYAALEHAHHAIGAEAPPRVRANALLVSAAAALGLERTIAAQQHFQLARAIIEREHIYTSYELISPDHLKTLAQEANGVPIPTPRREFRADTSVLIASLTKREREVLTLLPADRSMSDIAKDLFISPNTLKSTAQRLYRKLNVTSRTSAADIAHQAGLHITGGPNSERNNTHDEDS